MVSGRLWGAGLPAQESQPALPPPGPASDPGSQVRYALSPTPALVAGACSWTPLGMFARLAALLPRGRPPA